MKSRLQPRKSNAAKLKLADSSKQILFWLSGWQRLDWLLLLSVTAIATFGGFAIYSTELDQQHGYSYQHWMVSLLGLGLTMAIARWRYQSLLRWHWLIYIATNVSLIAVMVAGVSAKGAQRWIGVAGFNVQPSEFAKIAMVITLAALLHDRDGATGLLE